jgi:hypothetical protein
VRPQHAHPGRGDRWIARCVWAAGLTVALGAAIATAHGLYEVVRAAGAPTPIAGLYPLITDGLALVAYAATARLNDAGRAYAWTIVVLAAGLSGLAQASFLAGGVHTAPAWLRFGIGAWPATAAAIVAHLLYLLGAHQTRTLVYSEQLDGSNAGLDAAVQADESASNDAGDEQHAVTASGDVVRPTATRSSGPARERARAAAHDYHARNRHLPTVSQLMKLAQVARGTEPRSRNSAPNGQRCRSSPPTPRRGPINDHEHSKDDEQEPQSTRTRSQDQDPSAQPQRATQDQDRKQYTPRHHDPMGGRGRCAGLDGARR